MEHAFLNLLSRIQFMLSVDIFKQIEYYVAQDCVFISNHYEHCAVNNIKLIMTLS